MSQSNPSDMLHKSVLAATILPGNHTLEPTLAVLLLDLTQRGSDAVCDLALNAPSVIVARPVDLSAARPSSPQAQQDTTFRDWTSPPNAYVCDQDTNTESHGRPKPPHDRGTARATTIIINAPLRICEFALAEGKAELAFYTEKWI